MERKCYIFEYIYGYAYTHKNTIAKWGHEFKREWEIYMRKFEVMKGDGRNVIILYSKTYTSTHTHIRTHTHTYTQRWEVIGLSEVVEEIGKIMFQKVTHPVTAEKTMCVLPECKWLQQNMNKGVQLCVVLKINQNKLNVEQ